MAPRRDIVAAVKALASLFVGRPLTILSVAGLLAAVAAVLALIPVREGWRPWFLLVAAGGWALYAAWEWLVTARTPDADIRVDLLVIWPALAILTVWAAVMVFA